MYTICHIVFLDPYFYFYLFLLQPLTFVFLYFYFIVDIVAVFFICCYYVMFHLIGLLYYLLLLLSLFSFLVFSSYTYFDMFYLSQLFIVNCLSIFKGKGNQRDCIYTTLSRSSQLWNYTSYVEFGKNINTILSRPHL